MSSVTIKVEGLANLKEALERLGGKVAARVIKQAGRYAMKPVLEGAVGNLNASGSVATGLLRDSLQIVARDTRKDPRYPIEIGLKFKRKVALAGSEGAASALGKGSVRLHGRTFRRSGKKLVTQGAGSRWHFIEFGVPAHGIPAKPFLRPAMERNKEEVLTRFKDRLRQNIERQGGSVDQ